MKAVIRTPLSAAALAILLAACGGGGGGTTEKAVSSSPSSGSQASNTTTITTNTSAGAAAGSSASTGSTGNTGNTATPPATANPAPAAPAQPSAPSASDNTPAAPRTPSPEASTPAAPPAQPVPLVSANGVRGEVLLAMLSQKPCEGVWPKASRAPDGSFLSEGFSGIVSDSHMHNYVTDPDARVIGYVNTLGCNQQRYQPPGTGTHTYYHGQTVFAKFNRPPRDFVFLHVSLATHVGAETVTLYRHLTADGHGFVKPKFEHQLQAAQDYTFRLDANIPFGDIQQWTAPNPADASKPQFDKLMLLKGSSPRHVRLCWNTDLVEVKRLQCMDWQIQENWKPGTELVNLGQSLIEDRSVYPDESGFAHWK